MFNPKFMGFGDYNTEGASSSSSHFGSGGFLQNLDTSHRVSHGDHGLLGLQDSEGFSGPISPISSPRLRRDSLGNDVFNGSVIFQGNRVSSRPLATVEGSGEFGASYPEPSLRPIPLRNDALFFEGRKVSRAMEVSGSVILMAKDRLGSRVLQKLVDEGTLLDYKVVFREIINHVIEISTDPFGNYLVQKLPSVCDEEMRTWIESVLTSNPMDLVDICCNCYGTRVVQKMIETVKTKQQIAMVKSGLEPGFLALVTDLKGNHVIQTCLKSLGPNDNKFVLEAVTKYCSAIASDQHGCCVVKCCISNSVGAQRERLIDEICRNSLYLSQDPYGNYVVQCLIENNVSSAKLLKQFRMHYVELATQKFSSHVVEKCLEHYPESRYEIVRELLSVPNFEYLLHDRYGNYVIQTALDETEGLVRERLVEKVHRFGKLKSSPYCKKIFSKTTLKR